ncbi:hypothetical protein HDU92_006701 [Lobulomyces angularis]|nr:hypothetical protein HDU92_006701 [Lobulomyces angularis]
MNSTLVYSHTGCYMDLYAHQWTWETMADFSSNPPIIAVGISTLNQKNINSLSQCLIECDKNLFSFCGYGGVGLPNKDTLNPVCIGSNRSPFASLPSSKQQDRSCQNTCPTDKYINNPSQCGGWDMFNVFEIGRGSTSFDYTLPKNDTHLENMDLNLNITSSGCYQNENSFSLVNNNTTPEECIFQCHEKKYSYCGINNGGRKCFGVNSLLATKIEDKKCDVECKFPSKKFQCGGFNSSTIYQVSEIKAVVSQTIANTMPTVKNVLQPVNQLSEEVVIGIAIAAFSFLIFSSTVIFIVYRLKSQKLTKKNVKTYELPLGKLTVNVGK